MEYMLLIYNDENAWATLPDPERNAIIREYFDLTDEMRDGGVHITGAPLQPTTAGSTVRIRDGEQLITDGPFAETKEQLGGYFLIEADSDEEARAWAGKIPAARYGSIEVGQCWRLVRRLQRGSRGVGTALGRGAVPTVSSKAEGSGRVTLAVSPGGPQGRKCSASSTQP